MFLKNFSKLLSSTFLIQITSLLLYPFITRTWDPETFGQFSYVVSIGSVISIFASGQFHVAGMAEKDNDISEMLFSAAKTTGMIFGIALLVFAVIFSKGIFWYLLPFFMVVFLIFEIERMKSIRNSQINNLSIAQILSRISSNLIKLIPGPGYILLISEISGSFIGVLTLKRSNLKEVFKFPKMDFDVLKKYHKYPLFYSLNLGAQMLCLEIPAIILGMDQKHYMVGIYGICQRLMIQPMTSISNNVFSALFSVPLTSDERLRKSLKIALIAITGGICLKIGFEIFGHLLLKKYLGAKWEAGSDFFYLFSFILITKSLTSITLANYISTYTLERSIILRSIQVAVIISAYYFCGKDVYLFFKLFVTIDIVFDLICFIVSLKK